MYKLNNKIFVFKFYRETIYKFTFKKVSVFEITILFKSKIETTDSLI
ncbi:hypothetical protein LEP1GSC166_1098 [Leptospira kirschneri]|nr:hypothetical protein LEP1GSC166_1098 [Leptospira kirschneri]